MSNFYKIKYILLLIFIVGVFIMPNFFKGITKNIIDQIKYRETYVTGEITTDNGDGTYDVKINNASDAYKNVETRDYDAIFSIGEVVDIGYEYGNKESPKILGSSKKIPQEPKQVEVDYSGGCAGGGIQTITVTITGDLADGVLNKSDANYATCHNATIADLDPEQDPEHLAIGQVFSAAMYSINRAGIIFNIGDIPLNANIISAVIKLSCDTGGKAMVGTNFDIVIQDGQPTYPHKPMIKEDYNKNFYHNNGGSINTADVVEESYDNDITLNPNGIAWINKGDWTKFILRSNREIAGIVPTGAEGIEFLAANYHENTKPKLVITYTI